MKPILFSLSILCTLQAFAQSSCPRGLRFADSAVTASSEITSAVWGDFNEDGRPDVVVLLNGRRVALLNRGGGLFEPIADDSYQGVSFNPLVVATDVDRDGHLDLVHRAYNDISVARGNGHGTFAPAIRTILPANGADTWRMLDFNHDGLLDFVGFEIGRAAVTFTASAGDGTFREAGTVSVSGPSVDGVSTMAGDFDGDQEIDVVRFGRAFNSSRAFTRFAWNDGTLHFIESADVSDIPYRSVPVDIDGDGAEELAGIEDGTLVVARMKGRRVAIERFDVAARGASLVIRDPAMIDVDGDGIRDLVFATNSAVAIVRGTADGGFGPATFLETGGAGHLVALDVDGDGRQDLAPTASRSGLSVLYGAGLLAGIPSTGRIYPLASPPSALEYEDVDGDRVPDLVATAGQGFAAVTVQVLPGDGRGNFGRPGAPFVLTSAALTTLVWTADYDGDGRADLVASFQTPATKAPLIAFGAATTFGSPLPIDADSIVGKVSLGDLRRPGLVALRGDNVVLLTVSTDRSFNAETLFHRPAGAAVTVIRTMPGAPAQIAIIADSKMTILKRDGDSWRETSAPMYSHSTDILSADLDGDGHDDYVFPDTFGRVLYGGADQRFTEMPAAAAWNFIDRIMAADFDRDGLLDLVITSRQNTSDPAYVQVLRNSGNRTFAPYAVATTASPNGWGASVADFDGDGWLDVAVPTVHGAEVLTNACLPPRVVIGVSPEHPVAGGQVTLLVHALPAQPYFAGPVLIEENGRILGVVQPNLAFSVATFAWKSPALTAGQHTYTVRYQDQVAGTSVTTVTFSAMTPAPRRRVAR